MLRVWFVALLGLVASALVPVGSGTAAVTTYLCWGYDGCQKAGYSHAKYKQNANKMWWRMYSGHNCTNYVAYRIIQNGYSDQRPWTGSGNATNWGVAMKSITDTTPTVGSVAWWRAGDGVGSAGHVAYVEKVVSNTEIIVSQDSWGGDFSWRRITKSGGSWPTGFIHFNDRALENTQAPTLTGEAKVGKQVRMGGAKWKGKPTTKTRQWYADGVAIKGATKVRLAVTPELKGKKLTAKITATRNGWSSATASTPTSAPVAKGEFTPTTEPVLAGDPQLNKTLQVNTNIWAPNPPKLVVKWFADGKRIQDADGPKLTLAEDQVNAKIRARVVVNGPGYVKAARDTTETEPVYRGVAAIKAPTKVQGKLLVGKTLTAKPGAVTPTQAALSYRWLRDGQEVGTGSTYVVQPGDLGKRLSVETTASLDGYRPATSLTALDGTITTKPVVTFNAVGKKKAAVVKVKVTAPGMSKMKGTVRVKVGAHKVSGTLVDGKVKVKVTGVKTGTRKVRVKYLRTDLARPAWAVGKVAVN